MSASRTLALLTALALAASACGGGDEPTLGEVQITTTVADADGETTTTEAAEEATTTEAPEEVTTTEAPAETTTTEEETTTTEAVDEGSPLDFGPAAGTPLAIVSVRYDDTLNFREGPGVGASIVTDVAPLVEVELTAAGEAWQFEDSIWWKVNVNGEEAWANQRFLAGRGSTQSIFDDVAAELGVLKADTVQDMIDKVLEARGYEAEPPITITVSGEVLAFEGVGAFGNVDAIGFGDDSVKGERLRIEMDIVQDGPEEPIQFVVLTEVLQTTFCQRGVNEGICT